MDPFSEPLSSPKTLYESVPSGASFNIVWVYEYQGDLMLRLKTMVTITLFDNNQPSGKCVKYTDYP